MNGEITLHIIYTESQMLLSKKHYASWREIQDEFSDYKASLGPWPVSEILDFLSTEYPKSCLFSDSQIQSFLESDNETISA